MAVGAVGNAHRMRILVGIAHPTYYLKTVGASRVGIAHQMRIILKIK
jgi:hypothetical protein